MFIEIIRFSLNKQKWNNQHHFFSHFFERRAQTFNYIVLHPSGASIRCNSKWYRRTFLLQEKSSFGFQVLQCNRGVYSLFRNCFIFPCSFFRRETIRICYREIKAHSYTSKSRIFFSAFTMLRVEPFALAIGRRNS